TAHAHAAGEPVCKRRIEGALDVRDYVEHRLARVARDIEHLETAFFAPSPDLDSHYWISRSARCTKSRGSVTPIAFAVFRLTMSSNFCGCSTASSAGFAPRRILSTSTAARR